MAKKSLPIGNDDFTELRINNSYYVDKTLMIRDFIEMNDKVALIARPRRFGKTLNMSMMKAFFDITLDSRQLFEGLKIMETEYASCLNSRPVVYLTFKDCKASKAEELFAQIKRELYQEYLRYEKILRGTWEKQSYEEKDFYGMIENLRDFSAPAMSFVYALQDLTRALRNHYQIPPILLIDEYDQPIMSSYEYGYHDEVRDFFSNFYGSAMKGNTALGQALLTGVQRVAKESIFSQFNNPQVYTVVDFQYAEYFGLSEEETRGLLEYYGLSLDEPVKAMYDGYYMGGCHMYNPWSIICYAKKGRLDNYWVKTSANFLVKSALKKAGQNFWKIFDELIEGKEKEVFITLDTSFAERESLYSLWGLLVNAGYLTITQWKSAEISVVKIPNGEVMSEFQTLVSEIAGVDRMDLQQMFDALLKKDMERFIKIYEGIIISCTSYMDAKENAYHMMFLGMCISLKGLYRVTSNLESGYGRSDIRLEAQRSGYPHVIIELKQGENLEKLKKEALQQILDNRYYAGLAGEVICIGLAHDKKRCQMEYRIVK